MSARYIVRFDDICPTMNWDIWDRVEQILVDADVSPILAVVPNNRDLHLQVAPPRPDFWERVRGWQARGWTIGLHGDEHRYVTEEAGIVGLNRRSEFAGLPLAEQEAKIARGLATFIRESVRADLFVAPSHSFDRTTLTALKRHGIGTVSDGFYVRCIEQFGITFVPQQLWSFRPMPYGVWTVCYHHNDFTADDIVRLANALAAYRGKMTGVAEVLPGVKRAGLLDRIGPPLWYAAKSVARARKSLLGRPRDLALGAAP